jgi:hypothetical protein
MKASSTFPTNSNVVLREHVLSLAFRYRNKTVWIYWVFFHPVYNRFITNSSSRSQHSLSWRKKVTLLHSNSKFRVSASAFRKTTFKKVSSSKILPETSRFRTETSRFRTETSVFRTDTSGFRTETSGFWTETMGFSNRNFVFPTRNLVFLKTVASCF